MKNPRLRWKKDKKETGLRAVVYRSTGSYLHDGQTIYATCSQISQSYSDRTTGWYFVAGWDSNVPHKNTCDTPYPTEQEAKDAAMAYVKKFIANQ